MLLLLLLMMMMMMMMMVIIYPVACYDYGVISQMPTTAADKSIYCRLHREAISHRLPLDV